VDAPGFGADGVVAKTAISQEFPEVAIFFANFFQKVLTKIKYVII